MTSYQTENRWTYLHGSKKNGLTLQKNKLFHWNVPGEKSTLPKIPQAGNEKQEMHLLGEFCMMHTTLEICSPFGF